MPYSDLDIPRLRTLPFTEAEMLKVGTGVNFETPTLAIATEGNRRLLRHSGEPALVTAERNFGRGTHQMGIYIWQYNLALIQPGLPHAEGVKTRIHEAAHALRSSLRDWKPTYSETDTSEASFKRFYAQKALEEGFAEYLEAEIYGRQILGLKGQNLIDYHLNTLDKKHEFLRTLKHDKFQEWEITAYALGHRWTLGTLGMLECIMGPVQALKTIATAESANVDEITESVVKALILNF